MSGKKGKGNPKVDWFFTKDGKWQDEFKKLRTIVLGCGLTEELKWGKPCYTVQGSNVAIIQGFKEYCALLLPKGVLLKDPKGILVQQTENVQAARQLRFTSVREINASIVRAYVQNAIDVEKAGLEVVYKKTSEFKVPNELRDAFTEDLAFKKAFHALTPGRQRGYLLFFGAAKQSKTREARIDKYRDRISQGKGLMD